MFIIAVNPQRKNVLCGDTCIIWNLRKGFTQDVNWKKIRIIKEWQLNDHVKSGFSSTSFAKSGLCLMDLCGKKPVEHSILFCVKTS